MHSLAPQITPRFITDMMCLAKEQVECMRGGSEKDAGLLHIRNVLAHVSRATKNDPTLFREVYLPEADSRGWRHC